MIEVEYYPRIARDWLSLGSVSSSPLGVCMSEPGTQPLSELTVGSTATVAAISEAAEPHVARRLVDLGLTAGTEVTVVRKAPLHDPVMYRFRDTFFCLRDAQAKYVRVVVH